MILRLHSPLKYIGGKSLLASRIVAAFPDPKQYTTYLEPCGGAMSVLLAKPQWGHQEVYNDLNDDLCTFWRVVQTNASALVERLQGLPYSRHLYYDFHRQLFDGTDRDPLERAVLFFYVLRSTGTGWMRASPVGWSNSSSNAAAYEAVLSTFALLQERLSHPPTCIDNREMEAVIAHYDSPTTLHYVDPPYIGAEYYYQLGTRGQKKSSVNHEHLAHVLNEVKGFVALSYYPHPALDHWYPPDRWRRMTWQVQKPSAIHGAVPSEHKTATELLLCNYSSTVSYTQQELFV